MKEKCSKTKVLVGPPDLEIEEVTEMTVVDEQETAITNLNITIENNRNNNNDNSSDNIDDNINTSNITINDTCIIDTSSNSNNIGDTSNVDNTMNLDTNNTMTQTLSAEPVQVFTNYSSLMNSFNEHEIECNTKYNIHHMKPGFEVDTNILSHYLNKYVISNLFVFRRMQ